VVFKKRDEIKKYIMLLAYISQVRG